MDTMEECPIEAVREQLHEIVRPHGEVAAVRQSLQAYIEKNLPLEDGQALSTTNLAQPPLRSTLHEPPEGITGVRRAYWRALQAHQQAQAKYDALKTELQTVSQDAFDKGRGNPRDSTVDVNETYLSLARQREKRRKLQVIQRALSDIDNPDHGNPATTSLDDVIKRSAGELPIPPDLHMGQASVNFDADDKMMQLKRAVIAAKTGVDELEAKDQKHHETISTLEPTPEAQLFALQQARNELITWIETQLALIGDGQAEPDSRHTTPAIDGHKTDEPVSIEEIKDLYEGYLNARRKLVSSIQSPSTTKPTLSPASPEPELKESSLGRQERENTSAAAVTVLPYIQRLIDMQQEEEALLQHTASLRKQLSTAEGETKRLVARLAHESHLVEPGATRGEHWANAATDAGAATAAFVLQRVEMGMSSAQTAERALVNIDDLSMTLEMLGRLTLVATT